MKVPATLARICWPWLARLADIPLLAAITLFIAVAKGLRRPRNLTRRNGRGGVRLLIVAGFFNANWFRSHILPLVAARRIEHIVVVCHEPLFPISRVTYECPPPWLVKAAGRGLAKVLWFFVAACRYRPDMLMGYHIMPNALACLMAASVLGGQAVYQMTGGPIQIVGGGCGSEGEILRRLGRPSPVMEFLLKRLVRQFDLVVVRGSRARRFLLDNKLCARCAVITGSVDTERFFPTEGDHEYDIIYVARLVPYKGLEYFLAIMASLARRRPSVRIAIVGDGPLLEELQKQAANSGISDRVEFLGKRADVNELLHRARLFMLVSPSEGMSIAMLEAMSSGLPVVVADVGELRDVVDDGQNGVLIRRDAPEEAAAVVDRALNSPERLARMGELARATILRRASVPAVARQWASLLEETRGKRTVTCPTR